MSPSDRVTLATALGLMAVAVLATALPALHAMRVDPASVLRG